MLRPVQSSFPHLFFIFYFLAARTTRPLQPSCPQLQAAAVPWEQEQSRGTAMPGLSQPESKHDERREGCSQDLWLSPLKPAARFTLCGR